MRYITQLMGIDVTSVFVCSSACITSGVIAKVPCAREFAYSHTFKRSQSLFRM